ncbi:MAG: formate--tetrahydrofolate ligase [Spirochaetales bacterium]|nr:formate--tetrahydrofolate ligase [Spirochaetales bacterium]
MGKKSVYKTDLEIAREYKLKTITDIAAEIGFSKDDLIRYGDYMAKIKVDAIQKRLAGKRRGKLVLVSAITPTPAGEGKTTTSIGLSQALKKAGQKVIVALREPSLGPVFGIKGGAAGGGYSQVLPMEDINLHFTGDLHAVTAANNLIAAALDNHLHFGNELGLSTRQLLWKRVMDMNDRTLRNTVIGLGGHKNGVPRESGFDITAASEIMAILCLSMGYSDLKEKIGNILIGLTEDKRPVLARQLGVHGAAASLLKHAMLPNLVQTGENGPAFIHGGPFANIAQGASSIVATNLAMACSDIVVTEAGFGFDLGAEKFFDIVSPYGNFSPQAVVLVATVRACKMHGGVKKTELSNPNPAAVAKGIENLEKHLENITKFGVPAVVAINHFPDDTQEELTVISSRCESLGVPSAVCRHWAEGGDGALELANVVMELLKKDAKARTLYDWKLGVEDKITKIAREIYGAEAVDFTSDAKADLKTVYSFGYNELPVCIAKTQSSLSDNPLLLGRPKDFLVTVRRVLISAGAGFLVPLTGDIMRMPGLPRVPSANHIDIDAKGNISGLF